MPESLTEVLDTALDMIQAGESVETCLARFAVYAAELEPLLRLSVSIDADQDAVLPAEVDAWLATGAHEFAAFAYAERATNESPGSEPTYGLAADVSLDAALALMANGASVNESAAAFPEQQVELTPLLALGAHLRSLAATPLPEEMQQWLVSGAHDFRAIANQQLHGRRSTAGKRFLPGLRTALVSMLIAIVMVAAVDTASAQSLRGQFLYNWKLTHENVTIALTSTSNGRAWLHARYAQERIDEMQALIARGAPLSSPLVQITFYGALEHSRSALSEAASADTYAAVQPIIGQIASESAQVLKNESTKPSAPVTPPAVVAVQAELQQAAVAPEPSPIAIVVLPTATVLAPTTIMPSALPRPTDGVGEATALPGLPFPGAPTSTPTNSPTSATARPTASALPSIVVTNIPTTLPTTEIGQGPAATNTPLPEFGIPTTQPMPSRTVVPTVVATASATALPIPSATTPATIVPTDELPPTPIVPTSRPTATPTAPPTNTPTALPTDTPTALPTDTPTAPPTNTPTTLPTDTPTRIPTSTPTAPPTSIPTAMPTETPINAPIVTPTVTVAPTSTPTPDVGVLTLSPTIECIVSASDKSFRAYFGYINTSNSTVSIPVGIDNRFTPDPAARGQPTEFAPGRSTPFPNNTFSVVSIGSALVWHLNGYTATANSATNECVKVAGAEPTAETP